MFTYLHNTILKFTSILFSYCVVWIYMSHSKSSLEEGVKIDKLVNEIKVCAISCESALLLTILGSAFNYV